MRLYLSIKRGVYLLKFLKYFFRFGKGCDERELFAKFFDAIESMEVMREMFTNFETCTVFSFCFYHTHHMFMHGGNSFFPSWNMVSRQETPRISESMATNHKASKFSIVVSYLFDPIIIIFDISITKYGNLQTFL